MQLTPRQAFLQFGHVLQQQLFPHLEAAVGRLSPQLELLASVVALVPLARLLSARRARTGRPAKDRAAMATAFLAKAILNLPTTRDLLDRLQIIRVPDFSLPTCRRGDHGRAGETNGVANLSATGSCSSAENS
jgi:hypothetical protein